jgi:hypothetical protein
MHSRKLPLKAQTDLLPNDGVLSTASIFTESSAEIFPTEWHFITKLGPQVSPFPVPIFGVNNYTHEGRHKGLYMNSDNYEDTTPPSSSTGF